MRGVRTSTARWVALAAVLATLGAVAAIVLRHDDYTIHARFQDASGLVKGGVVELAGHKVGSIRSISLGPDGVADVEMALGDGEQVPLRRGVRASIRAVGLAGLNNRYVNLTPPPVAGAPIPDGGTLGLSETNGIVDLDMLMNAFDRDTRRSVQVLVHQNAELFAGSGSRHFNGLLRQAAPGLAQLSGLASELTSDQAQLSRLIATAGDTATALAARPGELEGAITQTARAFHAVNTERAAFADDVERLPGVLRKTRGTLREVRVATPAIRANLRRVPAAARPLTNLLRDVDPAARRLRPVVADLRTLLPDLTRSLHGLQRLEPVARAALRNTGEGLEKAVPALEALRVYTPDLVLGVFGGLGGISAASYDALGHYGRVLIAGSPQASTSGFARAFDFPDPPGFKLRTDLTAPCPGSAAEPAPDRSNVWVPNPKLCDPKHGHP